MADAGTGPAGTREPPASAPAVSAVAVVAAPKPSVRSTAAQADSHAAVYGAMYGGGRFARDDAGTGPAGTKAAAPAAAPDEVTLQAAVEADDVTLKEESPKEGGLFAKVADWFGALFNCGAR